MKRRGCCRSATTTCIVHLSPTRLRSITRDKRTSDGRDFLKINPKGFVPALELDDGRVLAEGLAVLVYVAQQAGELLPEDGFARCKVLEAISFMTTEVHGNFKPFWKNAPEVEKEKARQMLVKHFVTLAEELGDRRFLTGDRITIADPYLFLALMWAARHGIEVPQGFEKYFARVKGLPSVTRALAEEGLA